MVERRVSFAELAKATGRNVKTVQRWVYEGRLPRADHAAEAARYLEIDPNWLWPKKRSEVNPDLINLYARIGEVPIMIWANAARNARRMIDVATGTAPALPHNLADLIEARAREGVQIRLCLGISIQPMAQIDGVQARVHTSRNMIGIYRFDSEMVVWLNRGAFGVEHDAPALHLRQTEDRGVFDFYLNTFDQLWEDSEAIANHGKDWYRATL